MEKALKDLPSLKNRSKIYTLIQTCGIYYNNVGQVAQSVEQGTENPCVGSSILSLATTKPLI